MSNNLNNSQSLNKVYVNGDVNTQQHCDENKNDITEGICVFNKMTPMTNGIYSDSPGALNTDASKIPNNNEKKYNSNMKTPAPSSQAVYRENDTTQHAARGKYCVNVNNLL